MTILTRNKLSSFSPPSFEGSSSIALSRVLEGDPSSTYFQYPKGIFPLTPGKLVGYMQYCHEDVKLKFIQPFNRHLRQAKKLIENSDPQALVRAVKQASIVAKHPFTFMFVGKVLQDENL